MPDPAPAPPDFSRRQNGFDPNPDINEFLCLDDDDPTPEPTPDADPQQPAAAD